MVIKRVNSMSIAKMSAVIYALFGLIAGVFVSLAALAGSFAALNQSTGSSSLGGMFGAVFGVGAIIILPICYGIFGFIGGLVGGAIYNVAAGMMGGIEIEAQ
jgi:hypothetical protein